MMQFHATDVYLPSRKEVDHGEGRIQFDWKDDVYGRELLLIESDGFCSRLMPMNCGHGIQEIELERNRIRFHFWPTLAASLKMDREIEIAFTLADAEYGDLSYAVDCIGIEDHDVTDEEIRGEWEAELNRRIAEVEDGTAELTPAEEVHRSAREQLDRINRERRK